MNDLAPIKIVLGVARQIKLPPGKNTCFRICVYNWMGGVIRTA